MLLRSRASVMKMTVALIALIVGTMAHGNAAVGAENSSTMTAENDLFFGDNNNNDGPQRQLYIKQSGVETDEIRDEMFALSSNAPVATSKSANLVVDPDDFIMRKDSWDGSPIVMEAWKLIFFPIFDEGYTTWKQLFRRMLQHPDWRTFNHYNHHASGFKYLFDYTPSEVKTMMEDDAWTKAIFVRDPKMRVLSAYLDKGLPFDGGWVGGKCCKNEGQCRVRASETFAGFVQVAEDCPNPRWDVQSLRMEGKYWPYMNYIGYHEMIAENAKELLEKIGAWDDYGANGWGDDHDGSVFADFASTASELYSKFYEDKTVAAVESWYKADYTNKFLHYKLDDNTAVQEEEEETEETVAIEEAESNGVLGVEVKGVCGVTNGEEIPAVKPKQVVVQPEQFIMQRDPWDASPVVVEEHRLIFFAVPEVESLLFKQMLKRLEGVSNWDATDLQSTQDPRHNGLKYLYDFSPEKASHMMQSGAWTRAIFVRDPREHALEAYINLGLKDNGQFVERKCCPEEGACANHASSSFKGFLEVTQECCNMHWNSYTSKMDGLFWPSINFVGTLDNAEADVETLLTQIGAWDTVGKTGWGPDKNEQLFENYAETGAMTEIRELVPKFYDEITTAMVDKMYKADYDNRILDLERDNGSAGGRSLRRRLMYREDKDPALLGIETPHTGVFGHPTEIPEGKADRLVIEETDLIYKKSLHWDFSPIVVEKYKLIFFPQKRVASQAFKRLLRRMSGLEDWKTGKVSDPRTNGLKYLYNFTIDQARDMMEDDEWTKAMFVRDPKQKILSAYLEKGLKQDGEYIRKTCCPDEGVCAKTAHDSFAGFLEVIQLCETPYWNPQSWRIEGKFLPYLNFIGHLEQSELYTRQLLVAVGAWEEHGKDGWGEDGDESIFQYGVETKAWHEWSEYYGDITDVHVETIFAEDYENPYLDLKPEYTDFIEETEDTFDEDPEFDEETYSKCGSTTLDEIPDEPVDEIELEDMEYIYQRGPWDGAPVVVEQFKLLFFTVPGIASTSFKELLRRMTGLEDYQVSNSSIPHDPSKNGLKYLYDFDEDEAKEMMTSPDWTRAIFVQDPKARAVAAYLDIVVNGNDDMIRDRCCQEEGVCLDETEESFDKFLDVVELCCDPHWMPQTHRMSNYLWRNINFVGRFESIQHDTAALLDGLEAWDDYGASGWGETGDEAIFESFVEDDEKDVRDVMSDFYEDEAIEIHVEQIYGEDYANEVMGFDRFTLIDEDDNDGELDGDLFDDLEDDGLNEEDLEDNTRRLMEYRDEARAAVREVVGEEHFAAMRSRSVESDGTHRELRYGQGKPEDVGVEQTHEGFFGRRDDGPILNKKPHTLTLSSDDSIYDHRGWDEAPIVLEDFKLIFFTQRKVASKAWKQLFRRMMGYSDYRTGEVANPRKNGLRYLYDYTEEEAVDMLTSDEWTKALFARDPKERILSAFLEEGLTDSGAYVGDRCCPDERNCQQVASSSFSGFLLVTNICQNAAWIPQSYRMEARIWPFLTFIGTVENGYEDSKTLLEKVGAWTDFGEKGWGTYGNDPIFPDGYVTNAWREFTNYYTPDIEATVEEMFAEDYENKYLPYTKGVDDFMETAVEDVFDGDESKEDDSNNYGVENLRECGAKEEPIPDRRPYSVKMYDSQYVYKAGRWDGPPVILADYKIMFFTVPEIASTTFKKLFRRMAGFEDWNVSNKELPHNPKVNGLTYLSDFSIDEAVHMFLDTSWEKAIFSRDPKERILESYLTRVLGDEARFIRKKCCSNSGACVDKAMESFKGFLQVVSTCCSPVWMSQTSRMEGRYWKFMSFVGFAEEIDVDVKRWLTRLDIWDEVGASGWGEDGKQSIFSAESGETGANTRKVLKEYYDKETEAMVESMFADDYENPILDLSKTHIIFDHDGVGDDGEEDRRGRRRAMTRGSPERVEHTPEDVEEAHEVIRSLVGEDGYRKMLRKNIKG